VKSPVLVVLLLLSAAAAHRTHCMQLVPRAPHSSRSSSCSEQRCDRTDLISYTFAIHS
jgi:hypothetical protein